MVSGTSNRIGIDGQTRPLATGDAREIASERLTREALIRIVERQGYRCALSGRQLTPESACADHIRPLSAGGSDSSDNCQVLDEQVNRAKGTMATDDFVRMCIEVTSYIASLCVD